MIKSEIRNINSPFFSIILPTYNRANTIDDTIQSVINQTFSNWELIIVDDGSTDNTKDIISKYLSDKRIKYIYQTNKERSAARNTGINNATGDYICFIDSDDKYKENHLITFHNKIIYNPKFKGILYTKTFILLPDGNLIIKEVPSIDSMNIFSFIMHYTFTPINVCINKSILENIQFDESINYGEDLDLWLRIIANNNSVVEINEATAIYNAREDMFGTNAEKYLKFFKIIFNKPELKQLLPFDKKNMLLSKCYFHLAIKYESTKHFSKMYSSIFKSYFLFPKGYNNKTNKILLVMFLYNIPLIGSIIKLIRNIF